MSWEADVDDVDLDWPSTKEAYELLNEMGHGASAKVFKANCKTLNKEVAVKIIDLDDTSAEIEDIQREMQAIRACKHEHIVPLYTCFVVKESLWVVMKLLDRGSLLDIVQWKNPRSQHGVLEPGVIATVLKAVLSALDYLHKQGQIHRDVKAGNVLLGSDGSVQLADFGVSAWLAEDKFAARGAGARQGKGKKKKATETERKTFVGTPCWMAPEVMLQKPYNDRADIWSVGITALELATGMAPYAQFEALKVLKFTIEQDPPSLDTYDGKTFPNYKKDFKKFVAACLTKDPDTRPSAEELLKSSFIKSAKDKRYLVCNLIETLPSLHNMRPTQQAPVETPDSRGRFTVSWSFDDKPLTPGPEKPAAAATPPAETEPDSSKQVHMRLRLRNQDQAEMQDIKFEMMMPAESCEDLAEELVAQDLVRAVDCAQVVASMNALVADPSQGSLIFALFGTTTNPDESGLEENGTTLKPGYGQAFIGENAINPPDQAPLEVVDAAPAAATVAL